MKDTYDKTRLRKLRLSLGYSVNEFADLLGVHRSSWYRYEGSNEAEPRDIPLSLAYKISQKFNISIDWLVGSSNRKYLDPIPDKITNIYNSLSKENQKEFLNFALFLLFKEKMNKALSNKCEDNK